MSRLAANAAATRSLSLRALESSNPRHAARESDGNCVPFLCGQAARMHLRLPGNSAAKALTRTLVQCASAVMYPVFCLVTASGPFRRPAALRRSASATPPFRSWFLPRGHPPRKRDLALGSRAHSLWLRPV
jgi:hypothetical protein